MKIHLLGAVHRDPGGVTRLTHVLNRIDPDIISLEVSPASIELRRKWGRDWIKTFNLLLSRISRRMKTARSALMTGPGLRGVYEYIRLPYEYRAAMTYARRRDCPVFLVDDSKIAASYLSRVDMEILTEQNLTLLANADREHEGETDLAAQVEIQYSKAAGLLKRASQWPPPEAKVDMEAWLARENALAQRVRLLHQGLERRAGRTMSGKEFVERLVVAPDAVGYMPHQIHYPIDGLHLYIGGWEHLLGDHNKHTLFSLLHNLNPERSLCLED